VAYILCTVFCSANNYFGKGLKKAMDGWPSGNRIRRNNRLAKNTCRKQKKQFNNKGLFYLIALEKSDAQFLKGQT
jgi:hypothetical protein